VRKKKPHEAQEAHALFALLVVPFPLLIHHAAHAGLRRAAPATARTLAGRLTTTAACDRKHRQLFLHASAVAMNAVRRRVVTRHDLFKRSAAILAEIFE